jgi:hypothetical protein
MATQAGTIGFTPGIKVQPYTPNPEKAKYVELWKNPRYREVSPGEQWAQQFLEIARPERDAEAIDFGCGTGRGALSLALFGALKVTMLDFAPNCLDEDVANACVSQPTRMNFKVQDLTKQIAATAAYGYCCDVMEHIPTVDVPAVIRNILQSAHHVFFGISTVDDVMGALIGEPLHLTVQPMDWWVGQIKEAGAVVHWKREMEGACAIYCSAWSDANDVVSEGVINAPIEVVESQTRANIEAGWTHVTPFENQDREVVLLAGGPSMAQHIDEIKALRAEGCALVTVNGAYGWAIEHGMVPSAQIVLDAREFNSRFVSPQIDTCRYLIASQVHPSTLAGLPKERTYLWHSGISDECEELVMKLNGVFYPVPGGSTVVLRALPLLRMLGYQRFHMFGFDACVLEDGTHHAYPQAENDNQPLLPVTCGGRTFQCTPWMLSQASEFRDLIQSMGDHVELDVRGDGLIAWMLKTGSDLSAAADAVAAVENGNA